MSAKITEVLSHLLALKEVTVYILVSNLCVQALLNGRMQLLRQSDGINCGTLSPEKME